MTVKGQLLRQVLFHKKQSSTYKNLPIMTSSSNSASAVANFFGAKVTDIENMDDNEASPLIDQKPIEPLEVRGKRQGVGALKKPKEDQDTALKNRLKNIKKRKAANGDESDVTDTDDGESSDEEEQISRVKVMQGQVRTRVAIVSHLRHQS